MRSIQFLRQDDVNLKNNVIFTILYVICYSILLKRKIKLFQNALRFVYNNP